MMLSRRKALISEINDLAHELAIKHDALVRHKKELNRLTHSTSFQLTIRLLPAFLLGFDLGNKKKALAVSKKMLGSNFFSVLRFIYPLLK